MMSGASIAAGKSLSRGGSDVIAAGKLLGSSAVTVGSVNTKAMRRGPQRIRLVSWRDIVSDFPSGAIEKILDCLASGRYRYCSEPIMSTFFRTVEFLSLVFGWGAMCFLALWWRRGRFGFWLAAIRLERWLGTHSGGCT